MTYHLSVSPEGLSLEVRFEMIELLVDGRLVQLLKLPMALPFSRKAADLSQLGGGEAAEVYVFDRIGMDPEVFDAFAQTLCRGTTWLVGRSLSLPIPSARACIMVVSQGRPVLFIDTQGYDYARYVARLG